MNRGPLAPVVEVGVGVGVEAEVGVEVEVEVEVEVGVVTGIVVEMVSRSLKPVQRRNPVSNPPFDPRAPTRPPYPARALAHHNFRR